MIAGLAAGQHGRVARWQLLPRGVSAKAIRRRLEAGRLHLLHRGVYAVGYVAPTPYGREMAAVLAAGPGAVLSHRSAAVLWGLLPPKEGPTHVTRQATRRDSQPGITVHRASDLERDVQHHHLIPTTTPTRTLLDLAQHPELERALNEALIHRLTDKPTLLTRAVHRRGARHLRELLEDGPTPTRSELERTLLRLIEQAGLPRPRTNVKLGPRKEVDALWPAQRVIVEVDGFAFHSHRAAFENDRRRDAELVAAGYRVLRFTWRQLTRQPHAVVARLAATLAG